MKIFNPGDKVRLIYGSDEMIIHAVFGHRLVECEWTSKEGITYRNSFRPEYMELVSSDEDNQMEGRAVIEKITH